MIWSGCRGEGPRGRGGGAVRIVLVVLLAVLAVGAARTPGTETGCDAPSGYPRDCLTLPTGEGTHVDYMTPQGQIPPAFNSQDAYYTVFYWPTGCCSGTFKIIAQSALKHLPNDGVRRGIKFTHGGLGWNLRNGSSLCGGFWSPSRGWLAGYGHGACFGVHD